MLEQNAHVTLAIADEGHALTTGRLVPSGPASEPAQDPRIIETYLVSVVS
jgi:branched-chain amino acid transport system ATP-binding protein